MTDGPEFERCDFRRLGRLSHDGRRVLDRWMTGAAAIVTERWNRQSDTSTRVTFHEFETMQAAEALDQLDATAIGANLFVGSTQLASLFSLSNIDAQRIILGSLGTDIGAEPASREITGMERCILQSLLRDLAGAAGESWPSGSLTVQLAGLEDRPARTKCFAPDDTVFQVQLDIQIFKHELRAMWLFPERKLSGLLGDATLLPDFSAGTASSLLTKQMRSVPFDLVVRLGTARVRMSEVAGLQPGDVLLLDQRINDALDGAIGGTAKFRGRPGRIGAQQSFQIEQVAP